MRMAPDRVLKELEAYDPELGLMWDGRTAAWKFTHKGTPFMTWVHRDGTLAQADLSVGEALSLIKEADNRNDGDIRLKAMLQRIDAKKEKEAKEDEKIIRETTAQAHDRASVKMRGGPKPFVSGVA